MESFDLAWRFAMFQTCSFDWVAWKRNLTVWDFRLRQLCRVRRRSLDSVSAATLVHAFVSSLVDYCNAIFAGAPKTITDRLQRVLKAAARVVSDTRKFDCGLSRIMHIELHWLDVPERIKYKLGTWWTTAHQYPTSHMVNGYVNSASSHEVSVPRHRLTTYGRRALLLLARLFGELFARGHAGFGGFWGQLQAVTEDVFICAVLVCSAH